VWHNLGMVSQLSLPERPEPDKEVFQVSEFNQFINSLISIRSFTVEGEISEINISRNRWVFITLKDPQAEEVLNVFAVVYQIRPQLDLLQPGSLVRVTGYPKLRGKSGRFSLQAHQIELVGDGSLQKAFLQLKAKLEAEGLFDPARKRPLPEYPSRVYLLTAPDSRAYSDFIKITRHRAFGLIKIYHIPISVQGEQAVPSILRAFDIIRQRPQIADLAVITRGGGSLEDLQAFNQEEVVRAAFGLPIPLVSAIGHEADVSLIDYVADVRASTPSNAAEIIFPALSETLNQLELMHRSLVYQINNRLVSHLHRLESLRQALIHSFTQPFERLRQAQVRFETLLLNYQRRLVWYQDQVPVVSRRLAEAINLVMQQSQQRLIKSSHLLNSLNPTAVLKRGFSVTTDNTGRIIKSSRQVKPADDLITYLKAGRIKSQVKEVIND